LPQHNKIVSVGAYPELLWLREAVLKNAGFDVLSTTDENVALLRIRDGHCGVLLMCYSLPIQLRGQLSAMFRQHCPQGKIVLISNQVVEKMPFADEVVYGVDGPEVLIDAVRKPASRAA